MVTRHSCKRLIICLLFILFLQARYATAQVVNHKAEVDTLNQKSVLALRLDSNSALNYAQQAYSLAKQSNNKAGEMEALNNMGLYYQTRGEFDLSIDSYLKIIRQLEGHSDTFSGKALLGLAQIYKDMSADHTKDYIDKALNYSREAYTVFDELSDSAGLANSLSMSGILFRDKAKFSNRSYYDSAFVVFNKAIEIAEISHKGFGILPKLYNNISQVYVEYYNNTAKGLEYLFKAVEENKKINSVWGLSHNYGNISAAYTRLKEFDKGIQYARKMLEASTSIQRPSRIYNSYKMLSNAFKEARLYDSALTYYHLATELNDSLTNISRTRQVIDLETKYETAKKEVQIQTLAHENAAKNNRILLLVSALIATAVVTLSFIWLYRRLKIQKKILDVQSRRLEMMNNELQQQKKELEEVVSVKDKLFTVISHDLRTPLNTVIAFTDLIHNNDLPPDKLKSYGSVLKNTLTKTADMMNNLLHWAASQMHGFRPMIREVEIKEIAERAINEIEQQAMIKQVVIRNHVTADKLAVADANMVEVILRNLLTNAVKFVSPSTGEIIIDAASENDTVKILVSDNGSGMNQEAVEQFNNSVIFSASKSEAGTNNEQGTGLGLLLCGTLTKQMNGVIKVNAVEGEGTTFTVYLPAA